MSGLSGGQQFIRQVNKAIYKILFKLGAEDGEFWCECADVQCDQRVFRTLREFAALDQRDGQSLLSPTHQTASASIGSDKTP